MKAMERFIRCMTSAALTLSDGPSVNSSSTSSLKGSFYSIGVLVLVADDQFIILNPQNLQPLPLDLLSLLQINKNPDNTSCFFLSTQHLVAHTISDYTVAA